MQKVAVINPQIEFSQSLINVLAKNGIEVIVLVQKDAKYLKTLSATFAVFKNVEVLLADSFFGANALSSIIQGCDRIFLMHAYLEKFADKLEEQQALNIFDACARAKVPEVVFTTLESISGGAKSQIATIYNASGGKGRTSYSKLGLESTFLRKREVSNLFTMRLINFFVTFSYDSQVLKS